jgi:hypothetical protein
MGIEMFILCLSFIIALHFGFSTNHLSSLSVPRSIIALDFGLSANHVSPFWPSSNSFAFSLTPSSNLVLSDPTLVDLIYPFSGPSSIHSPFWPLVNPFPSTIIPSYGTGHSLVHTLDPVKEPCRHPSNSGKNNSGIKQGRRGSIGIFLFFIVCFCATVVHIGM